MEGFQLSRISFTNLCQWNSWSEFVNLDVIHREKVEPLFISKVCLCSHSIKTCMLIYLSGGHMVIVVDCR